MKLSFSTLGSPFMDMGQIIELAAQNGYHGVEIRAVGGTTDIEQLDEFKGDGLRETAKQLRESGLEAACVGTSVRFSSVDRAERAKALECAKVYMDIAGALGCQYIRTFGGPLIATQSYTESLKCIREGYELLCEEAAKTHVTPLIETHDDFSTSARVLDIIDHISARNIGVIWDILHPYRFGEAVRDTYAALKDRIRHVHVKDSAEFSTRGFDLRLLGEGNVPIAECIDALRAGGYDGYLSFEWEKLWHPEIPDGETAIPHYALNINKYLG